MISNRLHRRFLLVIVTALVFATTVCSGFQRTAIPTVQTRQALISKNHVEACRHRTDALLFVPKNQGLHAMIIADVAAAEGETLQTLLQNNNFWIFIAGIFPFAWATVEFWRRIAFGESFGTGTDSVVIGMDDSPTDSRGRRVLGKGALVTAVILFALAFGTIGVVLYSVLTSGAAPDVLPTSTSSIDPSSL